MTEIVLASGSAIRANILRNAGLTFSIERPDIDEAPIKQDGIARGETVETIALMLAEAKALARPQSDDRLIIGSDQIMAMDDQLFDKPADMTEARGRIKRLQGRAHRLVNGVCAARAGKIIWRRNAEATLAMRALDTDQIDQYLTEAGPDILTSVGAYQLEAIGGRLFENIRGDFFTVLGLPLFPLLTFLREEGAIAF